MNADDIRAEYRRLKYNMGWSFMGTSGARLNDAKLLIVGLNPGGREGGENWDCPEGNAFFVQYWNKDETGYNSLQQQIHRLHNVLGLTQHETLSANLVPFRSPSWRELDRAQEAVMFGRRLMSWLLDQTDAPVIALGNKAAVELSSLMGADHKLDLPTGWGRSMLSRYVVSDGRLLVRLPHLSRYQIFGRGGETDGVAEASLKQAMLPA